MKIFTACAVRADQAYGLDKQYVHFDTTSISVYGAYLPPEGSPDLSLTVPRYTNGRASDLNSLQEIIHVSRLSFFTHSLTRSFFVSSLKERNYTYSMYLSTVKVGFHRHLSVVPFGEDIGQPNHCGPA